MRCFSLSPLLQQPGALTGACALSSDGTLPAAMAALAGTGTRRPRLGERPRCLSPPDDPRGLLCMVERIHRRVEVGPAPDTLSLAGEGVLQGGERCEPPQGEGRVELPSPSSLTRKLAACNLIFAACG